MPTSDDRDSAAALIARLLFPVDDLDPGEVADATSLISKWRAAVPLGASAEQVLTMLYEVFQGEGTPAETAFVVVSHADDMTEHMFTDKDIAIATMRLEKELREAQAD